MNSDYTLALDPNVWYYLLRNAGGFILVFGLAASLAFGACKAFEFIVFEIDCGFFFKPRREFSLPSKASLLPMLLSSQNLSLTPSLLALAH